jgi:hypothetical protein
VTEGCRRQGLAKVPAVAVVALVVEVVDPVDASCVVVEWKQWPETWGVYAFYVHSGRSLVPKPSKKTGELFEMISPPSGLFRGAIFEVAEPGKCNELWDEDPPAKGAYEGRQQYDVHDKLLEHQHTLGKTWVVVVAPRDQAEVLLALANYSYQHNSPEYFPISRMPNAWSTSTIRLSPGLPCSRLASCGRP